MPDNVLGVSYFGPVEGSPLIPPSFVLAYLIITALCTFFLYKRIRKGLFITAVFVHLLFLTGIGAVAAYFLIPAPHVAHTNISQKIEVAFDRPVSRSILEKSISPTASGVWIFEDPLYTTHLYRKVVFYPTINPLVPGTEYRVTLTNIKNVLKISPPSEFSWTFKTPTMPPGVLIADSFARQKTVRLDVPIYLQQHALSCEVAALRMALALFGVAVSEDELLTKVGVDNTPHQGNTWGNPYHAFVGNVNGRQMRDGYGVYWGPIARVAREYRKASEFEDGTIDQVTQAISQGHPVVIWVYSAGGWPDTWNTSDGKRIYAVRDEHTVTVVGFVGEANNPTYIIVNDPLVGQVYWQRSFFDTKWNIFNRSGVVIE